MNCSNCNNPVNEKFCSNCGQPATLKRINGHYITHEISHLLHFEKGFFYNIKELTLRPGDSIRSFIADNRSKHMKPVGFLILTSLLFTLVSHLLKADEIYNDKELLKFGKSSIVTLMQWVQTHYGYANIIMGVFISLCVSLFFLKYKFNFFEITVLLCFVMGQAMFFLTVETLFIKVLNEQLYKNILMLISIGYPAWAIGQFFDKQKIWSYIKAFLAYMLGYVTFYLALVIIGLLTDAILKNFGGH